MKSTPSTRDREDARIAGIKGSTPFLVADVVLAVGRIDEHVGVGVAVVRTSEKAHGPEH
jgi:hypothetical protein